MGEKTGQQQGRADTDQLSAGVNVLAATLVHGSTIPEKRRCCLT